MPLPNFIIAGPPKTGTTSIFDWLSQHPEVCPSITKETGYFSDHLSEVNKEANFLTHGLSNYDRVFPSCKNKKIIAEATPEYIYSKTAIHHIKELPTNPHMLFVYRDPAERLLSEYNFHKFKTKRFSGSFSEFVGIFNENEFKSIDTKLLLRKWATSYTNISILLFKDLSEKPQESIQALCERIGIAPGFFDRFDFQKKNVSTNIKNRQLHRLVSKYAPQLPGWLRSKLQKAYIKLNTESIPELSRKDRMEYEELHNSFVKDEDILINEFGNQVIKA